MDKKTGFVKIYRSITKWGWYQDANTARVFIHCILMANFEDREWRGIKIPRGTFVTSVKSLCRELKLSTQNVRTALEHLVLTKEITIKTSRRNSIITVNRYLDLQKNNKQTNNSLTNNQQIPNNLLTTTKEYKERKKGRREEELRHIFDELRKEFGS